MFVLSEQSDPYCTVWYVYLLLKNFRIAGVKNIGDALHRLRWKIGIMACWSNGKRFVFNPKLQYSSTPSLRLVRAMDFFPLG
jgi:hypothetical protein